MPYDQFEEHLYDVTKIFPLNVIVRFYEDLSQDGLADRVVLGVEFVKTMESVAVLKRKHKKNKCRPYSGATQTLNSNML